MAKHPRPPKTSQPDARPIIGGRARIRDRLSAGLRGTAVSSPGNPATPKAGQKDGATCARSSRRF